MNPRRLFLAAFLATAAATLALRAADTPSRGTGSPTANTGNPTGGSTTPDSATGGTRSPGDKSQSQNSQSVVGVAINANAPDFTAVDHHGRNVYLRDLTNKIVVLEWFDPLCDYTRRDYARKGPQSLAAKYADKNVVWLTVNSTRDSTRDHNRAWADQHDLKSLVLDDARQRLATAYGVTTVPAYVILDPHQKVVYTGAIDDDESRNLEPKAGRTNYVDRALAQLTQGQPVDRPQSRLFGCPLLK